MYQSTWSMSNSPENISFAAGIIQSRGRATWTIMDKRVIGKKGEALAREFFQHRGFTIVDNNFRCRFGEIDLILRKKEALRFVEVKYRRTAEYGLPQESVVKNKQRRIRNAALCWIKHQYLPMDSEIHFDVLAISKKSEKIEYDYLEDAF